MDTKKPIIFCIVGRSGSGKDTILDLLTADQCCLQRLVYSTTRDKREKEVDGWDYNFKSESEYINLKSTGDIIEERSYTTVDNGTIRYFTTKDELVLNDNCKAFIVSASVDQALSYIKTGYQVYFIIIDCSAKTRLQRILERNCSYYDDSKVLEACRRLQEENEEFNKIYLAADPYTTDTTFHFINDLNTITGRPLLYCNEKGNKFLQDMVDGVCKFISSKVQ